MYTPLFSAALVGLGLAIVSVGGQDASDKPVPSSSNPGAGSNIPEYPDCNVDIPQWVGDGWCDETSAGEYNTEACGWDGGDCCECDCDQDSEWPCGSQADYACEDPYSTCGPCATFDGQNTVGDGVCDRGNYVKSQCLEDGGDCAGQVCSSTREYILGIEGENENGQVCCPLACGQCGGAGCGSAGAEFGLDNTDCCVNGVLNNQRPCLGTLEAPCYIDDDLCDPNPCGDNSVCNVYDSSSFTYFICSCEDGYKNTNQIPGDPSSATSAQVQDFECIPIDDDTLECSNGVAGIEGENDDGKACCPVECGQCGGAGCGSSGAAAGLGNKECCINGVLNNQGPCSETGEAPCKVDGDQPTCSNGVVGYEGSNDNGVACCPLGCTKCGGSGCATVGSAAGLTNKDCCINGVLNNQPTCDGDGEAPCVV